MSTLSHAKKILVLGATGGTGQLIIRQALAKGYDVTALVRSPEKGAGLTGVKLAIGDARDEAALRQAIRGQDAVVSALGTPPSPFKEVTLLSTATRAVVNAMQAEGVSRLVAITGIGAGDSAGHGGFAFDHLILPLLLRNVYIDRNRQEAAVRNSGLDWTLVRPSVLNDKSRKGAPRARRPVAISWRHHCPSGRRRLHSGRIGEWPVATWLASHQLVKRRQPTYVQMSLKL